MTAGRIRVLALGLFRSGDQVLVGRGRDPASGEAFYRPLGGGVEFGERAAAALRREIGEELGARIGEPRLLGVLENFFEYDGRPGHEIVFVFDAEFADSSWYGRGELAVIEPEAGWEAVQWMPLHHLASGTVPLVPDGLLPFLHAAADRDPRTYP